MKKKVLFITAYPPSEAGAAVKNTKYMLRELSQSFVVDLVFFKDPDDKVSLPDSNRIKVKKVIPNSKTYRMKNALMHPFYHPLFSVRYENGLKNWLQGEIDRESYFAIIFDHSQTFLYARRLKYDGIKVMLSHDIEAQRVIRSSNNFMYKLCVRTEKYVLSTPGAQLFALSQKDVDLIKKLYGFDARVTSIYIDKRIISITPAKQNEGFVMLGTWDRADNYEGALWLLNNLSGYISTPITINIIGSKFPVEKVVVSDKIKINVLGFVDNPYELISESKAMLCPILSGAGIKVKVIDSFACGTPVIGTVIAFEGFSDKYNSFMHRSDDIQSFAREIESIHFTLEERKSFREMFIHDFASTSIPKWIESELFCTDNE